MKRPTLGFGSGPDPTVREFESPVGLRAGGVEPAWDSLSLLPSLPLTHTLSLSQNKISPIISYIQNALHHVEIK